MVGRLSGYSADWRESCAYPGGLRHAKLDSRKRLFNPWNVDKVERAQIRLVLEHLASECRSKAAEQQAAMHAEHSARGILRSGATVKAALRIVEDLASAFVKDVVAAVADVAQDTDAFAMVLADVTIILSELQPGIDQAVKLATVSSGGTDRASSVSREANRLYLELQQRTLRLAELHRFSFTRPSPRQSVLSAPMLGSPSEKDLSQSTRNRGGKPRAEHWEDMWSSIAAQLYDGDLKPATQADIERAMMGWCVDKKIEIGETAIRERARKLWKNINSAP